MRSSVWIYASACAAIHALALLWVRHAGLLAISDDDYSRVVIAQQFAQTPHLDPSGTSWLPLPFWVTGAFMRVWGASLVNARLLSLFISVGAGTLLFSVNRTLGMSQLLAAAITLACTLLGSSLWLGAATVPEFPTAVLCAVGAFALAQPTSSPQRVLGALSLAAATASRYEAWPVAFAFAGWSTFDAIAALTRGSRREGQMALLSTSVALAFPGVWLLHGVLHHDNAFFFVQRVARYKQALGDPLPNLWELMGGYPKALFNAEPIPSLMLAFCVFGYLLQRHKRSRVTPEQQPSPAYLSYRTGSVVLVQLLVLVAGAAQGGAPTHHPERALLSVWLVMVMSGGYLLSRAEGRSARLLPIATLGLVLLGAHLTTPLSVLISESRLRADEEQLGKVLLTRESSDRIALLTPDYGYFAVMAAAGTPERFDVLADHDPRKSAPLAPLSNWLDEPGHCVLVASHEVVAQSPSLHQELETRSVVGRLALFERKHCDP